MKTKIHKQTKEIMPSLNKFKSEIQDLYNEKLVSLVLYGSYARGTATKFSDIDILLVLNDMNSPYEEINTTSEITINYLLDNDLNISIVPTTKKRLEEEKLSFYRIIKEEGILL
jgi:predicted nucleotidyltransferase